MNKIPPYVDTGLGQSQKGDTNSFNATGLLPIGAGLAGGLMDILNQKRQIKAQKDMNRFNADLQMEMWRNTSYPAQREMMEKAGLNPGLMYGQGGGGGQSIGTQGSNIPQTQGTFGQIGMQMAQQNQLMQAQKENIEADTNKKKVESVKLAGIDTQEGEQRILSALSGINLNESQINLIAKQIGKTTEETTNLIKGRQVMDKDMALTDAKINEIGSNIGLNEQQLKNLKEQLNLTKATTENVKTDTTLKGEQIQNIKEITKYIPDRVANEIRDSLSRQRSTGTDETNAITNARRQIIDEANKNREFRLLDEKNQRDWIDSAMNIITMGITPTGKTETIYQEKGQGWNSTHKKTSYE